MRLLLIIGSDEPIETTLLEFLKANRHWHMTEVQDLLGELNRSGMYMGGGGACPPWTLTVAPEQTVGIDYLWPADAETAGVRPGWHLSEAHRH